MQKLQIEKELNIQNVQMYRKNLMTTKQPLLLFHFFLSIFFCELVFGPFTPAVNNFFKRSVANNNNNKENVTFT